MDVVLTMYTGRHKIRFEFLLKGLVHVVRFVSKNSFHKKHLLQYYRLQSLTVKQIAECQLPEFIGQFHEHLHRASAGRTTVSELSQSQQKLFVFCRSR